MKNLNEILYSAGLIPVIKINDIAKAVPLARALKNGGLNVLEVTFRTSCAYEAILAIKREVEGVTVIAGTILNVENAKKALEAGAEAIVAPGLNEELVKWCNAKNVPVCPGISTASEIEKAMSLGLDLVKFFPAEAVGGINTIKALSAPYSAIKFMPTGGVNENNLLNYLANDKIVACGGSWMVAEQLINDGDFDAIENLTRNAVKKMLGFEVAHIGINCASSDEAIESSKQFANLLFAEQKIGKSSVFVDKMVECMKSPYLGKNGHIAISVNNISRAIAYLKSQGIKFNDDTKKFNDKNQLVAIYFENEIAGFAIHLLHKQ